jgi:hypothetical protein
MNQHLSSRQISEWVLGEPSPETERHVQDCPACRVEVTRLAEALRQFGCSVRQWSDGQLGTELPRVREGGGARSWMSVKILSWAGVAVMLVALATLSVTRRSDPPEEAYVAVPDTAVLEQIDRQVSRAVPGPMEPLLKFVWWEEGGSTADAAAPEQARTKILEE